MNLPKKLKKIIISRTDSIGDVILTLPLAGFIKSKWPDAEIFFIGKKYTQAIIESSHFVDQFLNREDLLGDAKILESIQAEAIIFVFPDKTLAYLAQKIKIPYRVGTSHRWFHWLYLNRRISFSRKKSDLHESQLNFHLLAFPEFSSETYIPPLEEIPAYYGVQAPILDLNIPNLLPSKYKVVLHPKSRGSAREWPLKNYRQLVESLSPEFQIFITGTQAEGDLIRQEEPELLSAPNVHDLTGKLTLPELITFIARVDALVACSTGPLHIASALGRLALGIYPPMKPIHPGRWRPVGQQAQVLVLDKDCKDCAKTQICTCIQSIEVEAVKNALMKAKHENSSSV